MFRIFTFNGRLSRNGYGKVRWATTGIAMMAVVGFFLLLGTVLIEWAWIVFPLAGAIIVLISLPATVRRLHDRNRSGWWLLAMWFLPLILAAGIYASGLLREPFSGWAFFGGFAVAIALSTLASIEIDFRQGTPGPNRFGLAPE